VRCPYEDRFCERAGRGRDQSFCALLAGIQDLPLHSARHSYAEIALASGVRLDVLSRTLGHSTAAFTADQYAHDSDEAAAEAAEIVGEALR
jgi:integrase